MVIDVQETGSMPASWWSSLAHDPLWVVLLLHLVKVSIKQVFFLQVASAGTSTKECNGGRGARKHCSRHLSSKLLALFPVHSESSHCTSNPWCVCVQSLMVVVNLFFCASCHLNHEEHPSRLLKSRWDDDLSHKVRIATYNFCRSSVPLMVYCWRYYNTHVTAHGKPHSFINNKTSCQHCWSFN